MLTNSNYVLSQYLVVMMTALLSWGIIKLLLIIVTRYLIFFYKTFKQLHHFKSST